MELFFSTLIGNLSFEAVMPFILSMDVPTIFNSAISGSGHTAISAPSSAGSSTSAVSDQVSSAASIN